MVRILNLMPSTLWRLSCQTGAGAACPTSPLLGGTDTPSLGTPHVAAGLLALLAPATPSMPGSGSCPTISIQGGSTMCPGIHQLESFFLEDGEGAHIPIKALSYYQQQTAPLLHTSICPMLLSKGSLKKPFQLRKGAKQI